jgi:hypothetical protein
VDDVFIGSEALAGGVLSRGRLRWNYRAIFPDVYIPKEATPSLSHRTIGAWLWSGRRGVIAGLAAAALHGSALGRRIRGCRTDLALWPAAARNRRSK